MATLKRIPCPRCSQETQWEGNPFRPFCSERCRLIDLGSWAAGDYKIPGPQVSTNDSEGARDEDSSE